MKKLTTVLTFYTIFNIIKKNYGKLDLQTKTSCLTKSATLFDQKHVKEKQIENFYHERIEMFNASLKFHTTESSSFSYFRFDYDVVNLLDLILINFA